MNYRFLSRFPESDVGNRPPGLSGLEILTECARSEQEKSAVEVMAGVMDALARGSRVDFLSFLDEECQLVIIGLDRTRLDGLEGGMGVRDTYFPHGMHFELVQAAADDGVGFVKWLDEASVATTGARYENLGTIVAEIGPSGKVKSYHEFVDVERLYAATAQPQK